MARSRSRSPRRHRSRDRSRSPDSRDRDRDRRDDGKSRDDRDADKRRSRSRSPPKEERRRKRRSGWDEPVTETDVAKATAAVATGGAGGAEPTPTLAQLQQALIMLQADTSMDIGTKLAKQQRLAIEIQRLQMQSGGFGFGGILPSVPAVNPALKRIYVGSLDYSVTPDVIKTLFSPFGTIVGVDMPIEPALRRSKGFCFVDFVDPASADAALQAMNGFALGGRPMKVNRPTAAGGPVGASAMPAFGGLGGFSGMSGLGGVGGGGIVGGSALTTVGAMLASAGQPAAATAATAASALNPGFTTSVGVVDPVAAAARAAALAQAIAGPGSGPGNPRARCYVGSVPFEITADQIKAVFGAFGAIRNCELLPPTDATSGHAHRGYGFIEFADEEAANNAIQAMNGFEIAGRRLKVGPSNSANAGAAPAVPVIASVSGMPGMLPGMMMSGLGVPGVPMLPTAPAPPPPPPIAISRVVLLENLVGPEEVDDELVGEIKEECEKYGSVETVSMLPFDPNKPVKAAVTFATPNDAAKAITNLHRRYFGGRVISARSMQTDAPAEPAPAPSS